MKRNLLLLAAAMLTLSARSQLTIQAGANFYIQSGATVTVQGDLVSNANIQGAGLLQMKGTGVQNMNMNGFTVENLEIDNTNNINLTGSVTISNNLLFTNGKMLLNGFDLDVATSATLSGYNSSRFVVTNGTGQLVKVDLGSTLFSFPVGYDASSYNPVNITQNGTAEDIGVRCQQNVLAAGTTGSAFVKEVVDASWVVTESVSGSNNITITPTWNGTDELPGFNRNKTGVSRFDGTTWDMTNAMTGAASGSGPYTITRSSVTAIGSFAIGTRPVLTPLLISPKVFLQGPFNSGTGLMNDNLRSSGLIPTTEPYTGMTGFTQSGSGGGETIPSSILAGTSTGADIVDWVFAELRDGSTGNVISTRSVLLQRDGSVVDVDGTNSKTSYINFAGELPNDYYVSIRHRNHLGIRTAATQALTKTTASAFDFSTSQSQAYQNPSITTNSAMALNGSVYMMWAGNINLDQYVRVTSQAFPPIPSDAAYLLGTLLSGNPNGTISTYSVGDVNMDGKARATSQAFPPIPSDAAYILSTPLSGSPNSTRRAHN